VQRFADAAYPEDLRGSDADLAQALREQIVRNVADYRPTPGTPWGTYLSGGTDSSSIAGILARDTAGTPVDSFSIGFGEGAYDELNYSRIAVRHFGLAPHERVVGEADSVALVPRLVRGFDEPFGNSSAIPTFYCADLAQREGKQLLIAGDGGDEIFGGNERYAKDQVFRWFHESPGLVRGAGRLLAGMLRGMDAHWANRIKNMVHRGLMPNPDRFYSDDSFASDHFEDMLAPDFRARVDRDDSLNVQREIFARAGTRSELHRLMYLDLQMTIAESDVVKVVRSAKMAGIDVAFPYLDAGLVAYTGRLPDQHKVKVLKKRHLFKLAMADILPVEIIKKKKQGFGLPIAVWMREKGAMRELVNDVLGSARARERGYVQPAFVQQLLQTHERGSWDYASEIFRLLMLELWHREYLDAQA
jgi:asparagine synthase (glutamine-hydrolysing)